MIYGANMDLSYGSGYKHHVTKILLFRHILTQYSHRFVPVASERTAIRFPKRRHFLIMETLVRENMYSNLAGS